MTDLASALPLPPTPSRREGASSGDATPLGGTSPRASPSPTTFTIPRLFRDRAARLGDRTARKKKRGGIWVEESWSAWQKRVDELARGLCGLGVKPGDAVAILSQSRAEWVDADLAILSAGGVTIPIYPSLLPDQVAYILENSDAVGIFVEDEAQLAKVQSLREKLPRVAHAIIIDGRPQGPTDGATPAPRASSSEKRTGFVIGMDALVREGWQVPQEEIGRRVTAASADDMATIVYTSGTTGPPKGVVQTHGNYTATIEAGASVLDLREDDIDILFLPLAHVAARFQSYMHLWSGHTTCYAESIDKLGQNIGEVRPTLLTSVPRIYEKIHSGAMAQAAASPLKKRVFDWALGVGKAVAAARRERRRPSIALLVQHAVADHLVFGKIRERLGGRLREAISGAAPLSREVAEFLEAAGIPVLEVYGLTETTALTTINRLENRRIGTVGTPIPGVELRIAEDGEILIRGPGVTRGYWKREEETRELLRKDGFLATGDVGELDQEGFLRITDRKKDLIKTSGGKYVAPQEVERALKADGLFAQAMVHGDRRKFCSAVLVLNREEVEAWARARGLSIATYGELVRSRDVEELITARLARVNESLASFEQVKRFIVSPSEWTPESGELTPTMKVKRKSVTARFEKELDALYDERY